MDAFLELLVCLQSVFLVLICPYTKVEESFNLQAMHDLLYHGMNLGKYDHHEFPGVVPRTFIGPSVVSVISYPFISLLNVLELPKLYAQYTVRIVLGLIVTGSLILYTRGVRRIFGPYVSRFLCVITAVQFHFLFYSSRPLPNTFALALVLIGLRCWLLQQQAMFIWIAGASIILFRFELAVFFGLILIQELVSGRLNITKFIMHVIPAGVTWLSLTVFVDSYFWCRWLWPEGEVLWFNTILNKSSQWGTSPIWWYFTSALPRSLLLPLFMIPWGAFTDSRSRTLLRIAIGFVCIYSLLPHKELRFIIYTIPLFNTVAAAGYSNIWKNRSKYSVILTLGIMASLIMTAGLSLVFLTTSISNYPGGHAFQTLHKLAINDNNKSIHIGVEAAMTGVSRFGETQETWKYSKLEDLQPGSPEMMSYDYILVSVSDYPHYSSTHILIHKEAGFTRLSLDRSSFPPLRIIYEDKIYVLQKNNTIT